jgi:hypothetical protein
MSYHLSITRRSTYLHAIVTGENTRENISNYLIELRQECKSQNCFRVLVEERLTGPRISLMDVFEVADKGSIEAIGAFEAIAYVDVYAVSNAMYFAETVARNRGIPIRMFSTVSAAEQWLTAGNDPSPKP